MDHDGKKYIRTRKHIQKDTVQGVVFYYTCNRDYHPSILQYSGPQYKHKLELHNTLISSYP